MGISLLVPNANNLNSEIMLLITNAFVMMIRLLIPILLKINSARSPLFSPRGRKSQDKFREETDLHPENQH